jgi:heat shock protein beta
VLVAHLQEGRVVRVMKRRLVRKSLDMLEELSNREDTSAFNTFHENFGRNLKLGIIEDKDNQKTLAELIRFTSSQSGDSVVSLAKYAARMQEGQKSIYFVAASSKEAAAKSPFIEGLLKKKIEVLYLLEPIDEVALTNLQKYGELELVDVSKEDVDAELASEDEKKEKEEVQKEFEPLTKWMAKVLGAKVEKVVVSTRLGDSPCILATSKFGWSANMERIMRAQAMGDTASYDYMKGRKIMEINPASPIINSLNAACKAPTEAATSQVELLYDTAMLTSGFIIEQPADFASRIFKMMNASSSGEAAAAAENGDKPKVAAAATSATKVDVEVLSEGDAWN